MISVEKIISKLIIQTKSNKIKWFYLSENADVIDICENISPNDLNYNSSFSLEINSGYFVLCEDVFKNIYLIIIPSLDSKDIQCINKNEDRNLTHQQELLRLQNLVKKQFPNVEDFLQEFMDD
ncbi:conserved hypothetical protein [Clostridiaceae bacterium BL-3]|nr:conserved hypothetical protein [Clostridiaceae bacterium BL-3]